MPHAAVRRNHPIGIAATIGQAKRSPVRRAPGRGRTGKRAALAATANSRTCSSVPAAPRKREAMSCGPPLARRLPGDDAESRSPVIQFDYSRASPAPRSNQGHRGGPWRQTDWRASRTIPPSRSHCSDAALRRFRGRGTCVRQLYHWQGLARPERFELPTPRSVVWCSIQLSYGRRERGGVAEPRSWHNPRPASTQIPPNCCSNATRCTPDNSAQSDASGGSGNGMDPGRNPPPCGAFANCCSVTASAA